MNTKATIASSAIIYQEIDHLIDNILMPATGEMFTPGELGEIFAEFLGGSRLTGKDLTEELSKDLYKKAFTPWLLFNWRAYKKNDSLAQILMKENNINTNKNINLMKPLSLSTKQKDWINEICKAHYSFYRMIGEHGDYEKNIILQDMLLEKEIIITIDQHSQEIYALLSSGIILAKVASLAGHNNFEQNIIVGIMPIAISNDDSSQIVELRQKINRKIEAESEFEIEFETRDINNNDSNYKNKNHKNNWLTSDLLLNIYEPFLRKCYFSLAFKKPHSLGT